MEWSRSVLAMPQARSSPNMMDSCLFSSFTQAGCQSEENEDNKSEEESQGNTKTLWGWAVGKGWLQTDGDKQDLSVSHLDLIR